jgi:hypothetical protein
VPVMTEKIIKVELITYCDVDVTFSRPSL